jgi:uncharacterized protein (DUF1684 family)
MQCFLSDERRFCTTKRTRFDGEGRGRRGLKLIPASLRTRLLFSAMLFFPPSPVRCIAATAAPEEAAAITPTISLSIVEPLRAEC